MMFLSVFRLKTIIFFANNMQICLKTNLKTFDFRLLIVFICHIVQ